MKKSTLFPILCLLTATLLCACGSSPKKTDSSPTATTAATTQHTHTPGEWQIIAEPTTTKDGVRQQRCTQCEEVVLSESIPAIGSPGLTYKENTDGKTCIVTGIGTCTDKDLVIGQVNSEGLTVTAIDKNAFQNCTSLTSVKLPNSIVSIGDWAFMRCENLTKINFPEGLSEIGANAFFGCVKLAAVSMPDSVTTVGRAAFTDCHGLKTLKISKNLTVISQNTFIVCTGLTSVIIPDGVEEIQQGAFSFCEGLTRITLPASITYLGDSPFEETWNLTVINYRGTKEQWNAIEKDAQWDNSIPFCTIHCIDGEI